MKKLFLRTISLVVISLASVYPSSADEKAEAAEPTAISRSTSIVTSELDKSIAFYTEFFGYQVLQRAALKSQAVLDGMGLYGSGDSEAEFVVLVAPNKTDENKAFSGINLIGVPWASESPFSQDPKRASPAGQLMFSFQVKNITEIDKRMRAAGVTIISELKPSSSGKSQTLKVFDPNGVRVDMYEYINAR